MATRTKPVTKPTPVATPSAPTIAPVEVVEAVTPGKRIRDMTDKVYISFKFLKNRRIALRDGREYYIPVVMREVQTEKGMTTLPDFDLEHIHKIELKPEEPLIRPKGSMSATMYARLVEGAELQAYKNQCHNDVLRYNLAGYVENGTVEIVDDPYDYRSVSASEYDGFLDTLGMKHKEII